MQDFEYLCPKSVEKCCALLRKYGKEAAVIAGGTDILVQLREGSKRFGTMKYLIDISSIPELKAITENGDEIEIGALATHTEIAKSSLVKEYGFLLTVACESVGSPQIRNLGTLGGSICNASPAADPLTPLMVLEAEAVIASQEMIRREKVRNLFVKSGTLDLKEGEFITGFVFKKMPVDSVGTFEKLGRRKALAISRMNVAVTMKLDEEGKICEAKICPGCVFAVPDLVPEATEILLGKKPGEELFLEAGKIVAKVMIEKTGRRWSTKYKEPVIEWLTQRALLNAAGMEVR